MFRRRGLGEYCIRYLTVGFLQVQWFYSWIWPQWCEEKYSADKKESSVKLSYFWLILISSGFMSKRHFTIVTIGRMPFFFFFFLGNVMKSWLALQQACHQRQSQALTVIHSLCNLLGRKLAQKLCHWTNEKEKLHETGVILDTLMLTIQTQTTSWPLFHI